MVRAGDGMAVMAQSRELAGLGLALAARRVDGLII